MAKDYAQKKPPKRRRHARRRRPRRFRPWLALTALVAVLAVLAGLFWLSQKAPDRVTEEVKTQHTKSTPSKPSATSSAKTSDDYWFYDLLEKKHIEVKVSPKPETEGKTTRRWVMQCGSFLSPEKADSLRAQIALSGLEANVMTTKEKDGRQWYRVVLGPYDSKRKAESDRHRLQDNGLVGCRIW